MTDVNSVAPIPEMSKSRFVASTAIVEDGVHLGLGVKVWHFTQIREGAIVGDNTIIGKSCFIDENVRIGDNSKIQNGAEIYAPAVVGKGVFIGPHVVLTNDLHPRAIAKDGRVLGASDWTSTGCTIGEGAAIGAGSVIVCTTVGDWALVGAGSVVTRVVPSHAQVVGNPAKQIGWVCFCGKRTTDMCQQCGWSPQ
ncbi:MAG: N-acetyltransferase [Acidobacteria bacterium]|nr:N-acetyltransferase [Acidobacteriota bacterium]